MLQQTQDRQCTYNVTLRRVYETIVTVEKQQVLYISVCVNLCVRVRSWGGNISARALVCACERVALLNQHATRRPFAICGVSGYTTFFDIFS